MKFVGAVNLRVAVITAMLIPGVVCVARAEKRPAMAPNEVKPSGGALELRASALPPQDPQPGTQQAQDTRMPSPAVNAGHAESAPIATYDQGQLTIVAENVRLSDVMTALHKVMGTEVDIPNAASDERIWARLGPGPARKVLSDLLSNTDLDYVIQGSSKDVGGIQSVTLTVRTDATPGKPGVSTEVADRFGSRRPPAIRSEAAEELKQDIAVPQEPAVAAEVTPTPPGAAAAPGAPPVEPPSSVAAAQQAPVDNLIAHPSPPTNFTPDQMAQQLANMYQQRRQLQQTQSGSTPN